jgi:ribosomal protein L11 methyltransferase
VRQVIDVGCGSGILAIAALKLGAERALGVDVDAQAVAVARANAALNHVDERLEVGVGSVREIRQGQFTLRQAPLVVANILAAVIIRLLDEGLADLLTPQGVLVLSGIIAGQAPEVEAALAKHNRQVIARSQLGDWVVLLAR